MLYSICQPQNAAATGANGLTARARQPRQAHCRSATENRNSQPVAKVTQPVHIADRTRRLMIQDCKDHHIELLSPMPPARVG